MVGPERAGTDKPVSDMRRPPDPRSGGRFFVERTTSAAHEDQVQVRLSRRPAIMPQTNSTMIEPTTAPISPAPSPARYQPSDWPR